MWHWLALRPFTFVVWRNALCLEKNQKSCLPGMGETFGFHGTDHNLIAERTYYHVNLRNAVGEPSLSVCLPLRYLL